MTNQALAWRSRFRSWGWKGLDYSARPPHGMRRKHMRALGELEPAEGIVLVHFSGYGRGLERLFASSARTLLLSHNITPEEWFWPTEPVEAVGCRLGREQLQALARAADRLAGVSDFNAMELRQATGRQADVIPVLFDGSKLGQPGPLDAKPPAGKGPTFLFVGRLTPHKRQDLLIRALAEYRRRQPAASLVLVGHPVSPSYRQRLVSLAEELAPGGVTFEAGLSPEALADRYRSADVFLCLSEHEGFCVPVLEAFHFGLPVVARNAGAVGEVVGEAGVLLSADDNLATVAEVLNLVAGDAELRSELRARGQARLEAFDRDRTAEQMKQALEALAGE